MTARATASDRTEVEHRATTTHDEPAIPVGAVHDPAEADADRLAEQALALAGEYADGGALHRAPGIHRASASGAAEGLSVAPSSLARAKSGGHGLDPVTRDRLESGFGTDLGAVRVHTGPAAASIARQIDARAFTHGQDVYFGQGEYRPGTADGDHVLAHEVAHTLQQSSAGVHRFPATWHTSPVPWKGVTGSVFRPGEGASGGVYILTSKDGHGPVQKAVAKPVFGENGLGMRESGQQLQFSDAALGQLLGLNAPDSKVVPKGTTEFEHLVAVCQPKQPPPLAGEEAVPLSAAESFVVMSEVPDASSIASLADKAPSDKQAGRDLYQTVFDDVFLAELGRLCIGDLMLGNPDRMVLGAMNLGNVMVSLQRSGSPKLAAIDTTAYLPKAVKPEDWAGSGGSGGGGFSTTKTALDNPAETLDGFFMVLIDRLKQGTPADAGHDPLWQVIERTYETNKAYYLSSFEFGWTDAMITAMTLLDDKKVDDLGAKYDDPDLATTTLKANLSYIAARADGSSHEDSIGRSMAITASGWVADVDDQRLDPSRSDALAERRVAVPSKKVTKAEVVPMPSLPSAKNVAYITGNGRAPGNPNTYDRQREMPDKVVAARHEIGRSVTATKKKRKGLFGDKEDVPRNRSVVSHYVAHATAVGAGGARLVDSIGYTRAIAEQAQVLMSADFRGSEANSYRELLQRLGASVSDLAVRVAAYRSQITKAADVVPTTRYGDGRALGDTLKQVDQSLDKALDSLKVVKGMDLRKAANQLNVSQA